MEGADLLAASEWLAQPGNYDYCWRRLARFASERIGPNRNKARQIADDILIDAVAGALLKYDPSRSTDFLEYLDYMLRYAVMELLRPPRRKCVVRNFSDFDTNEETTGGQYEADEDSGDCARSIDTASAANGAAEDTQTTATRYAELMETLERMNISNDERRILIFKVGYGYTNNEIADKMHVDEKEIRKQWANICWLVE